MKISGLHRVLICSTCSWLIWATPSQARFLQVDPVGYDDQINLYAYVGNDPINMNDSTGERRFGWLVELLERGERRLRSLRSERQAVEARRRGENVRVTGGRQAARRVERAAAENPNDVVRHRGHELRNGEQGSPHYQTEGGHGHTFYDGAAAVLGGIVVILEIADRLTNPLDGGGLSQCQDLGACNANGEVIPREQRERRPNAQRPNRRFEIDGDQITGNRMQGSRICERDEDGRPQNSC